ncbi:MAG: class I SAM-dependent methyltransferase [Bacillota bacterium]
MDRWNPDLYDDKISFVSRLGKELVKILNPQPGGRVLDLGCGTGDLTSDIANAGAITLGKE